MNNYKHVCFLLVCGLVLASCTSKKTLESQSMELNDVFVPHIERLSADLDDIMDSQSKVEVIANGFDWTEGPLWIEDLGLLFCDIPANAIYQWTESEGTKLYLKPSGYTDSVQRGGEIGSNGLLLDADGNLIVCQHGDRRLARMKSPISNPQADFTTIVDSYLGQRLNSPNDACISSNGRLYFTDPPYGLEGNVDDKTKELDFQGVYAVAPAGEIILLTKELSRPNGIALSPDESTLYVANSDPEYAVWMAYPIQVDGTLGKGVVFYDATEFAKSEAGLPDGLKVDSKGNIFASGPGGIWIFNAKGNVLGKVKTGQATSNCAFGKNEKVLYITADMYVMKVELKCCASL